MFKKTVLLLCSIACCFVACQEVENAKNAVKAVEEVAKNMEIENKKQEQKTIERRASGDTAAMHYTKLQAYLPANVDGYTSEEPKGETSKLGNMSFSNSSKRYSGQDGKYVLVRITDYVAAPAMFQGASGMMKSGFSSDNATEKINTLDLGIKDVGTLESFKKKTKTAMLTMAVGSRFIVTIEASQQKDTEFAKQIAKSMPLTKMVTL